MSGLRVGLAQMCSGTDARANLDMIALRAAEAREGGIEYLLTPEMSVVFAENRDMLKERTQPWEENEDVAQLSAIARANRIHLHVGSLAIALPDGRFANRSVLFDRDGAVVETYDKIHLFDADIPGISAYRESATYAGGNRAVVADLGGVRLGFSICYDMRFAALYRSLAQAGAQVIAVPAAFTVPTGRAHWEVLLRARAIETGCYILAAAQGGHHENGRSTYGHSMIIAPWGDVVAQAQDDAPGLVVADLDLDAVTSARQRVPALANGRDFAPPVQTFEEKSA